VESHSRQRLTLTHLIDSRNLAEQVPIRSIVCG
jgi:hypothetical protein